MSIIILIQKFKFFLTWIMLVIMASGRSRYNLIRLIIFFSFWWEIKYFLKLWFFLLASSESHHKPNPANKNQSSSFYQKNRINHHPWFFGISILLLGPIKAKGMGSPRAPGRTLVLDNKTGSDCRTVGQTCTSK